MLLNICITALLEHFQLKGTNDQLLIDYQKPHKPVSTNTISRWIKTVLNKAERDTSLYKAHSTKEAVTSAAQRKQVSIDTILAALGCSTMNSFAQFYSKPIEENLKYFGQELLKDGTEY